MGPERKFENCENQENLAKTYRFLRKFADFCENLQDFVTLQIFAKLPIFRKFTDFSRKFADFRENLQIFAKICRCMRRFKNFCENLQITKILRAAFS